MGKTARRLIQRISGERHEVLDDLLVVEQQVALFVNSDKTLSTACSPGNLRELTYGYLLSEGMIRALDDVIAYREEEGTIQAEVGPVECLEKLAPIVSPLSIHLSEMLATAAQTHQQGEIFQRTGGTHAVTIRDSNGTLSFIEDISRTCALEKALGQALIAKVNLSNSLIFLSSRIPMSMLAKIARCGLPIIGCVSAPTVQAVDLADKLGICLCGFVRGERLNIYSHEERIIK